MDKVKEILSKITGAIKDRWGAMSRTVHIAIIAGFSVVVVALVVLIIINSITQYTVLYSGASAEETTEIISVLQNNLGETDVKFNNAGDILVPANRVETLRAQLSMQGYPKSTFNYNIWDTGVSMFSTESDKRIKEKQQLQENLRATLAMFDGVDSAIVILTIPETNNYMIAAGREEASASVLLNLNHALSANSIDGIYNLVRTAVPGLKEENITVTDSTGAKLTSAAIIAMGDSDEMELYYKRIDFQQSITNILKEKLVQLFNGVFTDFTVGVDVQLNYNGEVSQQTIYTPSVDSEGNRGGMVENEKYVSAGGGNAAEGGLVGTTVDSDISPDYPTLRIGDGDEFYYETQKEINYLVNQEVKQIEKDGYSYDNISASVVVDATDLTQAEIEDWQKVIATAIGTSVDKVTFKTSAFGLDRTTGQNAGDGSVIVQGNRNNLIFIIITLGVVLIALLIVALVASGSSKKRAKVRRAAAATAASGTGSAVRHGDFTPQNGEDTSGDGQRYVSSDGGDFEIQSLAEGGEDSRDALLKKEIRDFSNSNPEIVAQLIRTWMRGDE